MVLLGRVFKIIQLVQSGIPNNIIFAISIILLTQAIFYGISIAFAHFGAFGTLMNLRLTLVKHIARLPLGFFQKRRTGELVKVVNTDVENYEAYLAHGFPNIISNIVSLIIMLVMVAVLDWRMLLTMYSLIPLVVGLFMLYGGKFHENEVENGKYLGKMSKSLMEYITMIPVIKAFNSQETKTQSFKEEIDNYNSCFN